MQCLFLLWFFSLPLSMVLDMPKHNSTTASEEPAKAPVPLQRAIGARIRKFREAKNIAQETFAYEAGLNRAWYGAVERGRYNITASNLARIALALNVEVGELFPSQAELSTLLGED